MTISAQATMQEISKIIYTSGVYSDYDFCAAKLAALLRLSDPAEVNFIMLHINRMIFCKNLQGEYIWCSREAYNFIDIKDASGVLGKTDTDLHWDSSALAEIQAADQTTFLSGVIHTSNCWVNLPAGNWCRFSTKRYPIYDAMNNIVGVLGVPVEVINSEEVQVA